ncbi:MAG: Protoheme IX farnesyltransferase [uncultured Thiotrichaceae bacterium]|uniref:Protoheme IX farnesyltransferase n=1 Tax=uncultured Thiotrichaceae bacterium TaxID=298394 RepID=A0A6S6STE4_9GAMM|nr:MAG: Protoheme IX farnesyltransferase [uncultured Thiotrichaceae bacterium]
MKTHVINSVYADTRSADYIAKVKAVYELGKPKVVMLIMFTAVVGMILALPYHPYDLPWIKIFWSTLGIGLLSSAGAVINHIVDRHADAKMFRTLNRPLPKGRLNKVTALFVAFTWTTLGLIILLWQANLLVTILTLMAMIGYAIIYTMFLKRTTPQNIVWGGAAGAAPPLLGWVAMTGELSLEPVVLFLIIFFWTPAHFWPLAIQRVEEYRKAKFPMLPVTHGIAYTKKQIVLYSGLLFATTLLPLVIGMSGVAYFISALGLNAMFGFYVYRLYMSAENDGAMRLFAYSIIYLMLLFAFLLADHFLYL